MRLIWSLWCGLHWDVMRPGECVSCLLRSRFYRRCDSRVTAGRFKAALVTFTGVWSGGRGAFYPLTLFSRVCSLTLCGLRLFRYGNIPRRRSDMLISIITVLQACVFYGQAPFRVQRLSSVLGRLFPLR